jgi:DNA repair exonuclease SbcCD nuclease subunit
MKIIFSSDYHLDHVTQGIPRFDELRRAVHEVVDVAIEQEVDAFVFGGDLCDPDSGACVFRAVRVALEAAMRLNESKIPNYWLVGNHDVIEDGSGDTTLDPLMALDEEGLETRVLREPRLLPVFTEAKLGDLTTTQNFQFLALPFTPTNRNYNADSTVRELLKQSAGVKLVVLSHLSMPGVQPGEETTEMPRGRDIEFPIQAFADSNANVAVVLQGHYHRAQKIEIPGVGPCVIPGSLARLTFSEEGNQIGYALVNL